MEKVDKSSGHRSKVKLPMIRHIRSERNKYKSCDAQFCSSPHLRFRGTTGRAVLLNEIDSASERSYECVTLVALEAKSDKTKKKKTCLRDQSPISGPLSADRRPTWDVPQLFHQHHIATAVPALAPIFPHACLSWG